MGCKVSLTKSVNASSNINLEVGCLMENHESLVRISERLDKLHKSSNHMILKLKELRRSEALMEGTKANDQILESSKTNEHERRLKKGYSPTSQHKECHVHRTTPESFLPKNANSSNFSVPKLFPFNERFLIAHRKKSARASEQPLSRCPDIGSAFVYKIKGRSTAAAHQVDILSKLPLLYRDPRLNKNRDVRNGASIRKTSN